jgi:hypothetical protein
VNLPKVRHRRVGFIVQGRMDFRPLVTVGAIADGGITITPKGAPTRHWRVESRPSVSSHLSDQVRFVPATPIPKLHYHRSGLTSIQPPGGVRVAIDLPGLDVIPGTQIFYFGRLKLDDIVPVPPRREDAFVVSHHGMPSGFRLAGIVVPTSTVPYFEEERIDDGFARVPVRGERVELVMSLRSHGVDALLILRPTLDYLPIPGAATAVLAGFAGDTGPIVTMCSTDGGAVIAMMAADEFPQFPAEPSQRSVDRWSAKRSLDGAVEYTHRI